MGNMTTLDDKTTDFLGSRMDPFHEDLLKKILAKWRAEGKKTTKGAIVDAGVELVAKQEGLYPECHMIVTELKPCFWDEEAILRKEFGCTDDDFGNEGVLALGKRHGLFPNQMKSLARIEVSAPEGT